VYAGASQAVSNQDQPVFLHVGCGPKRQGQTPFAGKPWCERRLDIDASVQPDLVGTMTDMGAVADASVDAVFSSHNIEHLYPHEVPLALREFRRVLKPDGFVLITCPDLQSVCRLVAENKLTEPAYQSRMGPISPLDILYGHRASMKQGNLYMAHRCGFTTKVLAGTLQAEGFSAAVKARPQHFDLWALGAPGKSQEWLLQRAAEFFPA
jgi:predicted SAM-dependent methyltransferase